MPGLKRIEHRYILFPSLFALHGFGSTWSRGIIRSEEGRESYLFGKTNFSPREFASYYYTRGRAFN